MTNPCVRCGAQWFIYVRCGTPWRALREASGSSTNQCVRCGTQWFIESAGRARVPDGKPLQLHAHRDVCACVCACSRARVTCFPSPCVRRGCQRTTCRSKTESSRLVPAGTRSWSTPRGRGSAGRAPRRRPTASRRPGGCSVPLFMSSLSLVTCVLAIPLHCTLCSSLCSLHSR